MKNMIIKIKNSLIELFKDDNSINEKSIIGFMAFMMMVVTLSIDIYTGIKGYELPIHEFVFDGFLYITIGALGIASLDKFWSNRGNGDK
jgi:hypothetical protein